MISRQALGFTIIAFALLNLYCNKKNMNSVTKVLNPLLLFLDLLLIINMTYDFLVLTR